jgi:subtilisin family serine protease
MSYSYSKLRSLVVASLLFSTVSVSATEFSVPPIEDTLLVSDNNITSAPNEVLVTFKEGVDVFDTNSSEEISPITNIVKGELDAFNTTFQSRLEERLGKDKFSAKAFLKLGAMHVKSDTNTTEELIEMFKSEEMSEYVEHVSANNMVALSATDDSYYNYLWSIENTAQEVNGETGTADADMDVAEAWNITKGDNDVIVAVLDTGVDYTHDDLRDNMWDGVTNHGYDFAGDDDGNNDDNPMPDEPYDDNGHYHGTHVAGTIGAVGDNGIGVSGVAQDVSIMALKVFRPNGYGYSSDILEALEYVADRVDDGENIVAVNASYGGSGGDQDDAINDAIKKLGDKGVVFCAAAGNEGKDIDAEPSYPASYDAENIISVAASDQNDALASFSNYGANSVDVAAPGTNILSTYPGNQYAYLQGTSMATPNVAGAVALLASAYPDSSVAERKAMLLDHVEKKSAFDGKMTTGGRININDALDNEPENITPTAEDDTITTAYETAVTIDVLANDSDENGDTLSITDTTTPADGSVTISDGKIVYTPNDGYEGSDSFDYTISDGELTTTATVTVTVEEKPNTAPVATDDTATTAYETAVSIDVLANDSDEDADALSITSTTTPSHGSVTINDGKVVYTPDDGYEGDDSFSYTISDGDLTSTANISVTVEEQPNTAPVALDDSITTAYETAVTIDVLANDSDEENDALTITDVSTPLHGSATIVDGKVVYTPDDAYEGEDTFSYTITDGEFVTTANVNVVVNAQKEDANLAPVAEDDVVTTVYETAVKIDVLNNDSDADNDALSISSTSSPENGSVVIESGAITYTPNDNFSGEDSFEYTITDGIAESTAKVTVTVGENPNVAPEAKDDTVETAYETAVTIDVLANDSDANEDSLSIVSTSTPSHGVVSISDGKVIYTPAEGYEGTDSFEYTISDGEEESTAKVSVTVGENPNLAPEAKDDTVTTAYETAVTIDVLANDSDVNEDSLSIVSTSTPSHGVVSISDGKIIYTPNEGYEGSDSFEYTITDGQEQSSATVIITVEEKPNTTPTANDDKVIVNYNESVSIAVLENDSDEDGDTLTIESYTQPTNGSVTQDGDKLVYTPTTNYSGDDSFTYSITDGEAIAIATVNVTVKEETQTIQLPIIGGDLGRDGGEEWEELDCTSHDVHFTTKEGNDVSIGLDQDSKLVGSIKVDDKESKVVIDLPDTTMKVDSNGETLIEFEGQDLTILMGDDGTITPTLPTAVVPKTELPVGTSLTVSGDLMKFVVPLSNEIKF